MRDSFDVGTWSEDGEFIGSFTAHHNDLFTGGIHRVLSEPGVRAFHESKSGNTYRKVAE